MEAANSGIPESYLDIAFGFDDPKYSDKTLLLRIDDDDNDNDDTDDTTSQPLHVREKTIHINSLILASRSPFFRKLFSNGMLQSEQKNVTLQIITSDNCSNLVRNLKNLDLHKTATTAPPKNIHVNSLILAARSPFFRKLFSNGESEQKHVTLQIKTSEEASVMDLLKYVYTNNLPTGLNALLDLLVIADKFEVASCLRDCTRALQKLPVTSESACLYLDLPQSLSTIQPLINAAKKFLVEKFKDFHKVKDEMLNLPLIGIQTVLSSDDLQVISECTVYDFVLTWARKHYPDLEERRRVMKTHLLHLVRFPLMSTTKLAEEVQTCSDIDPEVASTIVMHALRFKAETPLQRRRIAAKEDNASSRQFVERAYKFRPVKVVELEVPHQQSIVYLDLKRDELVKCGLPLDGIGSQIFHLGRHLLSLIAVSYLVEQTNQRWFLLLLKKLGSGDCTATYEVALRKKPSKGFQSCATGSLTLTDQPMSSKMLHSVPWTGVVGDDSPYFINDLLHLRVELTISSRI